MKMTTRLLIARHGNTFAPGDTVTRVGTTDLPLVESGLVQGQRLGRYLQLNQLSPDIIFTSKLQRAIQTAEQALSFLDFQCPMQALSIFNEIDYGPDENQAESEVIARLGSEALQTWDKQAKVPNGWKVDPQEIIKNWQDFASQVLQEYANKTVLVVTSNGIARFAPYLTGNFDDFVIKHGIKLSTGAFSVFEKIPSLEDWICLGWNMKP
jgi:probable phosphoglycerate mutase